MCASNRFENLCGHSRMEQIEGWTFEYDRKIDMLYAESQEYKYMQEASTA